MGLDEIAFVVIGIVIWIALVAIWQVAREER